MRKANNMSQDDVAKKLQLHGAVIGRYERDEVKPSIEMAATIAYVLEVSSDYLSLLRWALPYFFLLLFRAESWLSINRI